METLAGSIEDIPPPPNVESADAHYPPRVLLGYVVEPMWRVACACRANDELPWRTNIKTFSPVEPFAPADQQAIFQAEKTLLRASEEDVRREGRAGTIKQLNATISPSTLASVPGPGSASADTPQPSTEPTEGAAAAPPSGATSSPNVTDNDQRGNRRFGSRSTNNYSMTFDRGQNIEMRRTASFNTEVFGSARTIANFTVDANLNCAPPSPPSAQRRGRAWTALTVLGQSIASPSWNNISGAFPPSTMGGPAFNRPQFPALPGGLQRRNVVNRNTRFFEARYRFMVGPIPMTVRANVEGRVGLDVAGNLDCLGMSLDAIAAANLNLTVSFSINAVIVRAGIEGQLRLVDAALHASTSTRAEPLDGCVNWQASHGRLGSSLGGSLNLFTIVGFRWFQTRHDLNIANWQGVTWSNGSNQRDGRLCF